MNLTKDEKTNDGLIVNSDAGAISFK